MDRIAGLQDLQDKGFNKTNSDAQFIISGDQDLLAMHRFEGIDIVTVQKFTVYSF